MHHNNIENKSLPKWGFLDFYCFHPSRASAVHLGLKRTKFEIANYKKFIKTRLPRGLMGNVNEVLPMLLFLCSKHSSMMGGCLVPMDAGEGKAYQI